MKVRDVDPRKAPVKTAQDLVDTAKKLCTTNGIREFGFTLSSLRLHLRCDEDRLRPLVKTGVANGHFVKKAQRYFPQPSLQHATVSDLLGPVEYDVRIINGKWGFRCSWCGTSHRRFVSEGEVRWFLATGAHEALESHSLRRSRVVT